MDLFSRGHTRLQVGTLSGPRVTIWTPLQYPGRGVHVPWRRPTVLVGASGRRRKGGPGQGLEARSPPHPGPAQPHCHDVAGRSEGCEILRSNLTFQITFKVRLPRQENILCSRLPAGFTNAEMHSTWGPFSTLALVPVHISHVSQSGVCFPPPLIPCTLGLKKRDSGAFLERHFCLHSRWS